MKIKSGNLDVFSTGTVIQTKGEEVSFEFPNDTGPPLIIKLEFLNTIDETKQSAEFNLEYDNCLRIKILNANNSLGLGNSEIMNIGNYHGRKLYLNYRVYSVGKLGKTIHYTYYLGEPTTT